MYHAALAILQMAFGQEAAFTSCNTAATDMGKIYACPRCRRAKRPGPLKRPHPGFAKEKKNAP